MQLRPWRRGGLERPQFRGGGNGGNGDSSDTETAFLPDVTEPRPQTAVHLRRQWQCRWKIFGNIWSLAATIGRKVKLKVSAAAVFLPENSWRRRHCGRVSVTSPSVVTSAGKELNIRLCLRSLVSSLHSAVARVLAKYKWDPRPRRPAPGSSSTAHNWFPALSRLYKIKKCIL